jgi:hypothetical protein
MAEKTDTLKKSQKSLIKKANQRIIEFLFCERAKKEGREHDFPTSNQSYDTVSGTARHT